MTHYSYTAEKDGEKYSGVLDANDRFGVYQKVREEGGKILTITAPSLGFSEKFRVYSQRFSTVGAYDKVIFARTLAAMLTAGLPLSRALAISEKQSQNDKLKKVLGSVSEDIRKGQPFFSGLAKFPAVFPPLFVAMAKAGEESGNLPSALQNIAEQLDRTYKIQKQVKGALTYPSVVIVAMIGVAVLMITQVVPSLKQTFDEVGAQLPASTRAIMNVSDFLIGNTLLAVLSVVVFVTSIVALARTARGKRFLDILFVHMPILSPMVREVNTARASRTLASLVASGVDVMRALSITQEVVQNSLFKDDLKKAEVMVTKGEPLSRAFEEGHTIFPLLFGEMIAVGEETGAMSDMLNKLAIFYEGEVEQKTKNLSTIIEPLLMLFIGGGVGFFALAIISPIYGITQNV